jgi:hypothetical protein
MFDKKLYLWKVNHGKHFLLVLSIAVCNVSACLSVCRSTQQIKDTFCSFLEVQVEVRCVSGEVCRGVCKGLGYDARSVPCGSLNPPNMFSGCGFKLWGAN